MARMYNASQVLDMLQLDEDLDGNESDYPEDFETESDEEDVSDLDDNDNLAVNVNAKHTTIMVAIAILQVLHHIMHAYKF